MGTAYLFKCTNCDYSTESSGKKDWGMCGTVRPYICNDCKELTDVLIGKFGEEISLNN